MKTSYKGTSGLTLIELILAVILLSLVILTGLSMEIALRRLYQASDTEAQLMGDAAAIMTFVSRKIQAAPGDVGRNYDPLSITTSGSNRLYSLRHDANGDGIYDVSPLPADGWDIFMLSTNTHVLYYQAYGSGTWYVLSTQVINFTISDPFSSGNGTSTVTITLRRDPTQAVSATNQEITSQSSVNYRLATFH